MKVVNRRTLVADSLSDQTCGQRPGRNALAFVSLSRTVNASRTAAAAPAAWTADICGAVKDWKADWARRVQEIDQAILRSRGLDERRTLYVDFWDETVRSTTELVGDFDAAGHPAVRGGEAVARGYRGVFAETVPAMEMALAVATALPEDPERFSEGEAEIRTNMARAFAIRNHDLDALHDRLEASLPAKLRDAFDNDPTCRAI